MQSQNVVMGIQNEDTEALKSLAIKQVAKVKQLQSKVKAYNDQIKENLLKDQEYAKMATDQRTLTQGIKGVRNRLMQFPENLDLERKKKDLQTELKDARDSLSSTVIEWSRQTQLSLFEHEDTTYRINKKADVRVRVRRKSRRKFRN